MRSSRATLTGRANRSHQLDWCLNGMVTAPTPRICASPRGAHTPVDRPFGRCRAAPSGFGSRAGGISIAGGPPAGRCRSRNAALADQNAVHRANSSQEYRQRHPYPFARSRGRKCGPPSRCARGAPHFALRGAIVSARRDRSATGVTASIVVDACRRCINRRSTSLSLSLSLETQPVLFALARALLSPRSRATG